MATGRPSTHTHAHAQWKRWEGEKMRKGPFRTILKSDKGQNLVEFALVVPLLLLLVIGIAEFGRAWMTKNIMTGAAREAVRMAAVPPPTGMSPGDWKTAIRARADNVLNSAGITPDNVIVIDNVVAYD